MTTDRDQRLAADYQAMQELQAASTILDLEASGEPPDRYTLTFRGKGLCREMSSRADVETVELHRCDIRLPYSYPQRPPDIRWLTPMFHPNVSFSGFINLRELGLTWEKDLSLDLVAERLWDVARLAYMDLDKATNYAARNWIQDADDVPELPVDPRPLRDKKAPENRNVIRYERRDGDKKVKLPDVVDAEIADVVFIGEDTPTPDVPRPAPPPRPSEEDDDDIFYIGE